MGQTPKLPPCDSGTSRFAPFFRLARNTAALSISGDDAYIRVPVIVLMFCTFSHEGLSKADALTVECDVRAQSVVHTYVTRVLLLHLIRAGESSQQAHSTGVQVAILGHLEKRAWRSVSKYSESSVEAVPLIASMVGTQASLEEVWVN